MPKSILAWITLPLLGLSFVIFLAISSPIVKAATSTHVVISEIQIAGVTASDEFVELYNPTSNDISLNGWRLTRKTDKGSESNLVSSLSGTIKAHGYFLITPQSGYTGSIAADETYSVAGSPIAANGTVLIYSDAGDTLIDKVGFGLAADKESMAISNPASSSSAERKAGVSSTFESMTTGEDVALGNGEDTDSNLNDFVIRLVSQPQNSSSAIEMMPEITPTPTSTVTPTVTPTTILTPTDTPTPTNTPMPTTTLSPTPTETPSPPITPTPTNTPMPTPTVSPTPSANPTTTPTMTPTATPSVSPTPVTTVTPRPFPTFPSTPQLRVVCLPKVFSMRVMNMTFQFPYISCTVQKI